MYPVSAAYKEAIKQNVRDVRITGTITLKDESIINITDADIVLGSLYFSEQCVSGEDIEVGNVYASELGLALTSPPENPYSLDGARIIINFGINVEPDPADDPVWEYVPLGYFYVTEIERKEVAVNLKALDGMILFDTDLSGVLTTGTPYALIQSCCTKAGVTLANDSGEFAAFANGLSAFTIPEDSKIETCRDLIMWICQATGTFARMNRAGQLEIIPVTAGASVKTISKQERFTSEVSDFYVKITKVAMKVGEEEYSSGTDGMTLALEENPLLAGKSEAEINAALAEILDQVTKAEYTPYSLTCAGDPALQAGDWVKLTGVSNINGPEFEYSRSSVAYHPETGEEVPADTPIFMPFAGDKQGLLMEEGTENLLTETQSSWEMDISSLIIYGNAQAEQSSNWAWHGNYSAKVWDADSSSNRVRVRVPVISDKWSIFSCYVHNPNTSPITVYAMNMVTGNVVVLPGETKRLLASRLSEWSGGFDIRIYANTKDPFFIDGLMFYRGDKNYHLSWHIGGGTRANPLKRITLPEPLPATFGIGIAAKMLHAHDAADRTFWECGGYRCYFDSSDNKLKMTNGVVTAETAAVTWGANDYVGVYVGRENGNLFIQAKIAGALTDRVEAEAGAGAGTDETLYVGSRADGSESVNAVVADMVFHDRPEDIDPEGYLSQVPGGGE